MRRVLLVRQQPRVILVDARPRRDRAAPPSAWSPVSIDDAPNAVRPASSSSASRASRRGRSATAIAPRHAAVDGHEDDAPPASMQSPSAAAATTRSASSRSLPTATARPPDAPSTPSPGVDVNAAGRRHSSRRRAAPRRRSRARPDGSERDSTAAASREHVVAREAAPIGVDVGHRQLAARQRAGLVEAPPPGPPRAARDARRP